jgi:2-polyprenyl-3-methyl-5-hydroxy-6-metoxy-1,4-benzoquinol methylase
MDVLKHNKKAWDYKVMEQSIYTRPVDEKTIKESKNGKWEITVTTHKHVPKNWLPKSIKGLKILCLASGGGQQGPILAAAGADVTVMDLSENQLKQDKIVAQ